LQKDTYQYIGNYDYEIKILKAQKDFISRTFGNYPIESSKPALGKSSFEFRAIENLMSE